MILNKNKFLLFVFIGFVSTFSIFSKSGLAKSKARFSKLKNKTKKSIAISRDLMNRDLPHLDLANLQKYKYVIFDGCKTFWNKSLYELLYSHQKTQGISWSDCFKFAKYGMSYLLGTFDLQEAYGCFLMRCKGKRKSSIIKTCSDVWQKECKNFICSDAKLIFEYCKKNNIITILTETGIREFYNDFLKLYPFDYVCASEIEYKDGCVVGKLKGEPCSGKEKLRRVKEIIENKLNGSLKDTVFYANSHNDIFLLNEVGKAIAVNPDSKLNDYAKSKKWEILEFKDVVKN